MKKEYKLNSDEFTIGGCYLLDDKRSHPFVAIEIFTEFSTKKLAEMCFGDEKVNKEHNILYSITPNAINDFIDRFPLLYSTAYVLNMVK